jgi:cobalt-zinc-cadmium efflux system protein
MHVWAMSASEIALSAHLVMPKGHPGDEFFAGLGQELHDRFHIGHPTIQVEIDCRGHGCGFNAATTTRPADRAGCPRPSP